MPNLSRRDFLKLSGAAAMTVAANELSWRLLQPISVDNPLAAYPDRDWETIYRYQYRYD